MSKKKQTKKKDPESEPEKEIVEDSMPSIFNALRNFKKLSSQEALVFIQIMKKGRVTVEDVSTILKTVKDIKPTTTKPYAVINNLITCDVLFCEDNTCKKKTYRPINPRDLVFDVKEKVNDLDAEITRIETLKEVISEINEPPKILPAEYQITNEMATLSEKGYKLSFYYNRLLIKEEDGIFKRITKTFNLEPEKGNFSMISAVKEDETKFPYIAILLVDNLKFGDRSRIMGNKIVDPEVAESLIKGVVVK